MNEKLSIASKVQSKQFHTELLVFFDDKFDKGIKGC